MNESIEDFFVLYSYVHINYNHKEALIVNTETNTFFYTKNALFLKAFASISLPTIYYMFPVAEDMKYDKDLMSFLESLELGFCGEFVKTTFSNRPVQFSPLFKIANNTPLNVLPEFLEKNVTDNVLKGFENELGNNILSNILDISIYYSTLTDEQFLSSFPIHKQYLFPIVSMERVHFDEFSLVFGNVFPRLCKINLVVGNLTEIDITLIKNVIKEYKLYNKIVLYIVDSVYQSVSSDFIELFSMVYVWHNVSSPISKAPKGVENLLLLDNDSDVLLFENNSDVYEIYPLYSGENYRFCRNYLSFNVEDLMIDRKITEREIFMNQHINSNFFGEISIYPTGEVYSCKSRPCIGNIRDNNIKSIVFNEMNTYRYWHLTRNSMPYCKECVFNWLCPPVTHSELEMNKWNFCNRS